MGTPLCATLVTLTARSRSSGWRRTVSSRPTSSPRLTDTHSRTERTSSFSLRVVLSILAVPWVTPALSCPTPSPTRCSLRSSSGATPPSTQSESTCCPRSSTKKSPSHILELSHIKLTKPSTEQSDYLG